MKTSGQLSIQTAASTDGEINTNVSGVNSGSLVTLGQNSTAWTGGTAPPGGSANTSVAPYGMREYYGYQEYVPVVNSNEPVAHWQNLDNNNPVNQGYNWKGFNSYWTSGTTPPGWLSSSGRYGAYSTYSVNFSGGGFQTFNVSRFRFYVDVHTGLGTGSSGGRLHRVSLYCKEVLRSSKWEQINTNAQSSYSANQQPTYWGYATFEEPDIPTSFVLDVDHNSSAGGFLGGSIAYAVYRAQSTRAPGGTPNYSYNIAPNLLNGSDVTYPGSGSGAAAVPALSANQSAQWVGDIDIRHSTECATSIDYASLKFGLIMKRSGFEDTLISHGVYGHRSVLAWQGGLCF